MARRGLYADLIGYEEEGGLVEMSLNLPEKVILLLSERKGQEFTAKEIAQWIFENFPEECQKKRERSAAIQSDKQLLGQITAEIQLRPLQRKAPEVSVTQDKPRRYYWQAEMSRKTPPGEERAVAVVASPPVELSPKLKEHDLYPMLSDYLWSDRGIYPMRIDERKSSNKRGRNGNKWLFPDLVGMEDLTADWHEEIKGSVTEYSDKKAKLWSFEVKLSLSRSDVREAYFQAVSNSSWANFGYLVAAEISGSETMKELQMLFSRHGIGLIEIDADDPGNSQVRLPARERSDLDWVMCNRLAAENRDFLDFIKKVRQFHQTGDPLPSRWGVTGRGGH